MTFSRDDFRFTVRHDYAPAMVDRRVLIKPCADEELGMTPQRLRELCGDGTGAVNLIINRESTNGYSIRLLQRSGPRGMVMCGKGEGRTLARFSAKAILRWLDRMEGNSISRKENDGE